VRVQVTTSPLSGIKIITALFIPALIAFTFHIKLPEWCVSRQLHLPVLGFQRTQEER
jgi:hypothetical protein